MIQGPGRGEAPRPPALPSRPPASRGRRPMTQLPVSQRLTAPRRAGRLRRTLADNLAAYAFMAAGIVCFGLFSWYPLVKGVELSFQQNNFVDPPQWVGLTNFRHVVS